MISEKFPRFCALDRARGLAMILMVMAHFGPGVYERVGIGGIALDILNVLGRMATPSFIMVFGITLAFVHIRKAQANEPGLRRSLTKRAGMVFAFSLVVSLPQSLDHVFNTQAAGLGEWLYGLALRQYNVLTFYALAILTTAVFIHHIARDPLRRGLLYGATLVFTGSFLGYDAWPEQPGGAVELLRLVFVSGKYAVFTSLGLAWMMIAVGIIMRDRLKARQTFHHDIATIAVVLCLTGLATGRIVGWRELSDLHLHYNGPPQYWYMTMVAGVLLLSLLALDRFTVPMLGKILGIVGRSPLHFYVAHAFVLPAVGLIRFLTPGVSDTAAIGLSMGAFVVYCGLKISREYRTGPMGRRPLVGLNP